MYVDGELFVLRVVVEDRVIADGVADCVKGVGVDPKLTTEDLGPLMNPGGESKAKKSRVLGDGSTIFKITGGVDMLEGTDDELGDVIGVVPFGVAVGV